MSRVATLSRLPLLAAALVAGCFAPEPPLESDEFLDVADTSQGLGVTCVGTQDCSGSGTVYTSTYRVGATATSAGEVVQTFVATTSATPARVSIVARNLRSFSGASPQLHARIYGPITGRVEDADFSSDTPVASGSIALTALASTQTTITLTATDTLTVGATYALHLSADGVGASGSGSTLVGVGAIAVSTYADGSAFRTSRRSPSAWGALQPQRFRPSATFDVAFAMSGGAGSPCAAADHCSAGLVCHLGSCFLPNPTPVAISPASPTVDTNSVTVFSASGGDGPYVFSLQSGGGALAGTTYTAPTNAGSASVRVTDMLGFTSDAAITIVPATQAATCSGLPANAVWNTVSSITQTWNGSAFQPSPVGTFNATASTTTCVFRCATHYTWSGSACVADTQVAACTGLPSNAAWNTVSSITQTWDGSAFAPGTSGTFSTTPSTTNCVFQCSAGFTWSGSACSGGAPTPTFFWIDASDASTITKDGSNRVTQWRDKSGLGRHANVVSGNPTWTASATPTGLPAVAFADGSARLDTAFVPSSPQMTIFVVYKMNPSPVSWSTIIEQAHDTYFALRISSCCGGGDNLNFHIRNENAAPLLTPQTGAYTLLTAMQTSSVTSMYYSQSSVASFSQSPINAGGAPLSIGRSNGGGGEYLNGGIAEIRAFSSALSLAERTAVENELRTKWLTPTVPSGLAHCWGAEGNANDSVGTNHATAFGNVTYTAGRSGQAFTCAAPGGPGTGVVASARPSVSTSGPWAYEFWIKRNSSTNDNWAVDRNYAGFSVSGNPLVDLHLNGGGSGFWYVRNDAGVAVSTPAFTLPSGEWHHLAVVRTGGLIKTYRDGLSLGDVSDPGGALTPDPPRLCSHADSTSEYMTGQFESVKIWNRALTGTEVANLAAGNGSCTASP